MDNLEDVITASLEDIDSPDTDPTPVEAEAPAEPALDATPEAPEAAVDAVPDATIEVDSPATRDAQGRFVPKAEAKPVDDFDKKFGLKGQAESGRENRIPYSRVKKITEKAVKDATDAQLTQFQPKLTEFETKVKDYEGRLAKVAEFEDILQNRPEQFLELLSTLPAYTQFFQSVRDAFEAQQNPAAQATPTAPVTDDMPAPDQELSDGTMVYSLEGLKALNAWNRGQARKEVMQEVETRYKPLEEEWKAHQKVQAIIPQVQAQINTARTWKGFNENEPAIIKALQSDASLTLKEAYYQVIDKIRDDEHAKWDAEKATLQANRTKMREELLAELKQAPKATSGPAGVGKPEPQQAGGPRNLEDIIAEQVKSIRT